MIFAYSPRGNGHCPSFSSAASSILTVYILFLTGGFDVISVSKYRNLTLSTNCGSQVRNPKIAAKVTRAHNGLKSSFFIELFIEGVIDK